VRLSPPRESKDQERAFTSRESPGESMAAVGVRRNDEQDAMGEFTTDLLARGEERAAHVRGISVAWLGHSMALSQPL